MGDPVSNPSLRASDMKGLGTLDTLNYQRTGGNKLQ